MIKFIFGIVLVVGLVVFGLRFSGYQFYPENLHHYLQIREKTPSFEIEFTNGTVLKGEKLGETPESIRLNVDGAVTDFSKLQIKSTRAVVGGNAVSRFIENAELQHKIHPLFSKDSKKTLQASFDRFLMEPSKLAEQMKKNNPGLSQTEAVAQQMQANAQARLNDYKRRAEALQQEAEAYQ